MQPQYRDGDRCSKTGTWTVWKEASFILHYDFRYNLLRHCHCSTSVIKNFKSFTIFFIYVFLILLDHYILLKHKVKNTGSHSPIEPCCKQSYGIIFWNLHLKKKNSCLPMQKQINSKNKGISEEAAEHFFHSYMYTRKQHIHI